MHKSGYSFSSSKCKRQPMLPIKIAVYSSSKCLRGKQKDHCQASCVGCLESAHLQGKSEALGGHSSVLLLRGWLAWAVGHPGDPPALSLGTLLAGAAACRALLKLTQNDIFCLLFPSPARINTRRCVFRLFFTLFVAVSPATTSTFHFIPANK